MDLDSDLAFRFERTRLIRLIIGYLVKKSTFVSPPHSRRALRSAHLCLRSIDIAFSEPLTLPNNQFIFEPRLRASSIAQANRSRELASFDKFRNLSASQARVSGQIALAD
jgi:hypothetical protein